ncbi:MAG TPA: vWA domain-containing protein [Polyangiaceae bacterium]|nr:vWA domain-containing protein [Polyangiaceae bacterium]
MTNIGWLCVLAAGASLAAMDLAACSASTGGNNGAGAGGAALISGSGGVSGASVSQGGAAASTTGTGAKAGTTTPIGPPGSLGGITSRPMDMGSGPDGSCGELPFMAEQVVKMTTTTKVIPQPIDLYIMWDQSLSMTCAISSGAGGAGGMGGMANTAGAPAAGEDRWDAVKGPLSQWVMSVPADPPFNVGIGYFGDMLIGSCFPQTYETPDVEIGPLPQNANAIVSSLNAHMPNSNTPTPAAIQGALNHATAWKQMHPNDVVAVVLVTDGEPNACGAVADVANIAAQGYNNGMGIKTFVIGVTSPGTTCALDPNPPNVMDLDTVAKAGGTGQALVVDVTQDASKQLTDELNMIRTSITMTTTKTMVETSKLQCQFTLPMNVNMTQGDNVAFDKDKVNVELTNNQGVKSQVYRVDSMDKCSGTNALGWYYDNDDKPTQIFLCPNACSVVQVPMVDGGVDPTIAGMAPKASILLGCKSLYAPPA